MTGISLSSPAGRGCYLDRMLEVIQIGSTFHGHVAIWGQQQQRVARKATRSFLHPELFCCRVTSDTSLHLSYKTPKEYCKPAKASVKIPPPGTQSESKR